MPIKSRMSQREFKEVWRTTSRPDRKFISAMIVVAEALGLKGLRYGLLPRRVERLLKSCDRKMVFSILAECIGLLSRAPAMQRVKQIHRKRRARRVPSVERVVQKQRVLA
jgi:hypothetical protein